MTDERSWRNEIVGRWFLSCLLSVWANVVVADCVRHVFKRSSTLKCLLRCLKEEAMLAALFSIVIVMSDRLSVYFHYCNADLSLPDEWT